MKNAKFDAIKYYTIVVLSFCFFFVIASLLFSWHPNQNSEISFPGLHDSTLIESVERYIYGNIEEIIFDISISLLIVFFFTGIIAGSRS
jgi:hypothetical protein